MEGNPPRRAQEHRGKHRGLVDGLLVFSTGLRGALQVAENSVAISLNDLALSRGFMAGTTNCDDWFAGQNCRDPEYFLLSVLDLETRTALIQR